MGDFQQWTAQHAIVNPKLKVLREEWVAAKKELTRLKSVSRPSQGGKLGKVIIELRAWLTAIKARSVITAKFGSRAIDQSVTMEAIIFLATAHMLPTNTEMTNMKRTADFAFHHIQEIEDHQAHREKVTTAKMKELLEEANNMTKMLKSENFKETAEVVESAGYWMRRDDDVLLVQPEGSAEWERAYGSKLRMQSAVYERMLMYSKADQKDKKITALMAQLGVKVARQQVLWDCEFEDVWRAVNAHNNYLAFRVMLLDVMREMDEAGEKRRFKWYDTKKQSLITEFVGVEKSEGGKSDRCKKLGALSAKKKYRLWRQRQLTEYFGIDEASGAASNSVKAKMADLQIDN